MKQSAKWKLCWLGFMCAVTGCIPPFIKFDTAGQDGSWTVCPVAISVTDSNGNVRKVAAAILESGPEKIQIAHFRIEEKAREKLFSKPVALSRFENPVPTVVPASEFASIPSKSVIVGGELTIDTPYEPDRFGNQGQLTFKLKNELENTGAANPNHLALPYILVLSDKQLHKLGWKGPIATSWNEPSTQPSD